MMDEQPALELYAQSSGKINNLSRIYLLWRFHQLLCQCHQNKFIVSNNYTSITELYMRDSKLIREIIQDILETGEYTLEGIAYYARMPLDLFIDIMCEKNIAPSMTLWSKVISLYLQVKPELAKHLFETITNKNDFQNCLRLQSKIEPFSLRSE